MAVSAFYRLFLVLLAGVMLSACEIAEGIFKAGMGVGIFLVVVVVALVFYLVGKVRRHV
jgi:hypothetical protein